jgi:hypothetical protein
MSTVFAGAIPPNEGNFGGVTGFDFTVNTTGDVDGIWWYQPTGSAAAVTPGLYDTQTQALLATAPATAGLPAGAWSLIPLAASVSLTPGTIYTAACYQNNRIAWYPNAVNDVYVYNSPFTVMNQGGRVQAAGALQFPANFFQDAYAVDVNFTATEPCEPCPPTEGFFINLTAPGFINVVTGVGNCVIEALEQTPAGAPCRQCLLLPTQAIPWDNCGPCVPSAACSHPGQVALAIREVYGSERFPQPLNASWRKCNHRYEIVRAVVSVTRCVPAMAQDGAPPTCSAELAAAVTLENDRTAVRQAIACCLSAANLANPSWVSEWVIGGSTTVGELGGCAGVETEFFVGVQSCLCPN